jgi:hypothetical protein
MRMQNLISEIVKQNVTNNVNNRDLAGQIKQDIAKSYQENL